MGSEGGVEGLSRALMKAHHDLCVVEYELDKEFKSIYPQNGNPMKLVGRIKNIKEEVSFLQQECRHLLSSKQELIDKTSSILIGNTRVIERFQESLGIPSTTHHPAAAISTLTQVIHEWTTHITSKQGEDGDANPEEDINNLLFASIVGST